MWYNARHPHPLGLFSLLHSAIPSNSCVTTEGAQQGSTYEFLPVVAEYDCKGSLGPIDVFYDWWGVISSVGLCKFPEQQVLGDRKSSWTARETPTRPKDQCVVQCVCHTHYGPNILQLHSQHGCLLEHFGGILFATDRTGVWVLLLPSGWGNQSHVWEVTCSCSWDVIYCEG
jgi:hypothetical protein